MTFQSGESELTTAVAIMNDTLPEDTETFIIRLQNPTGGAELGAQSSVITRILVNDNAFGIVEFAPDSLEVRESESVGKDKVFAIRLRRTGGVAGSVIVKWEFDNSNAPTDIQPTFGKVEFAPGSPFASIPLTIKDDNIAEMDKAYKIYLRSIVNSGTDLPGRGAKIGANNVSTLIIQASDNKYGVFSWELTAIETQEPTAADGIVKLFVIREQGVQGNVVLEYMTTPDGSKPADRQAISGADYTSKQGTVTIAENTRKAAVDIFIKSDDVPERSESFLVKMNTVRLLGGNTPAVGPSIKKPGDIATVTIMENDDAAGIIQFDIAENKNQVDTYEGIGILRLNVARTVGTYGNVTVSWRTQALDIPAAMVGRDFIPGSGNITFIEGQKSATIDIQIIDDSEIEGLEMFEVILDKLSNPSARIGTSSRLKIGIVKNDSPNGEFGFVESQKIVREGGIIRLTVERTKSLQGRVNLRWSLNVNAKPEFMPPANGEITFNNGERLKSFDLQAKVDSTLEGAENYTVSLVSNDNNGDISPTKYQCVITIQADDGAAGKAHIVPSYRQIFMGEPSASYNGKGKIRLTRGIGKFGTVTINWQITPRNTGAFVVEYGTVTFLNLQAEVDIVLQSRDDTIPEGKRDYVLEISGGSGEVSSDVTKIRSIITMVASDFPHGLFQFLAPSVTTASEDSQKIQVIVNRDGGNQGQVRVGYATVAGTAKDAIDYASATGTIEFLNGETQKTISVTILQDTLPEGPEYFFINLTSVALTSKVNNNYTKVVGDLGLDMPPILGPGRQKKVIIEKNDNAEGTVQFAANAINFLAKEDEGMARIPLVRTGGSYGTVGVRYRSNNRTATSTLDYKLPDGSIEFADGVTENTINVTIVNDLEREFGEEFEVILISIYGGAQLGDRTMSLVTIAKSDYPNGKFGFVNDVKIAMTNPDIQKTLTLTVERTEGTLGEQTVFWRIMGYNDPNSQLFETNDVSTMINNKEETTGQLAWTAGELGQKIITLQIKPHVQWEIQKIFWIELYRISGVPATSGSGEVSPTNGKTELTILKFGDPNGIIGFDVQSRQVRTFSEPASSQPSQIDFQLFRSKGLIGAQQIYWEINSPPGSSNKDVSPTSGFVTIGDKKSVGNIKVLIEPDDIPELDEAFSLKLLKIVGGAEIDPQFNSSQFIIQFNDYPHGTVGVLSKNQAVIVRNDKTRAVRVNVTRNAGRVGRIRATFIVKYQQDSTYTATGEAIFEDGDRFKTAVVDAPRNVFIPLGSQFAITLTDVTYIGGRGPVTQAPIIVANQQTCTVAVPQAAANSKVGFAQQEVNIDEASNTASVSVIREGSYGSLEVSWAHGFPPNQLPSGFQMGLIITAPGIISFSDGESEKKISIKVRPNVSRKELFAIYMPIQPSKTPDGGAMLYVGKTVTRMESMGVIRFAANSLKPRIQENIGDLQLNVERLYGSEGTIQVLYSTLPGTAKGGVDYVHVTNAAVKLDPGVTQTTIKIQMKSDSLPEEVEYFFVNLTTVYQLPNSNPTGITPRISKLNALSNISVAMNSDPYGLLYMEKNQLQVSEGETINLTPHVKRGGGTKGDISVMIRTALKGEIVPNYPALQPSADGTDVMKLNQNIFIKGGTVAPIDPIRLQIVKDALIEGNEIFYVYLTQPTGGAVISAGSNTYKSYVEVMIKRNGLWGGEVGFYQTSSGLTIDEDGKGNVTVTLIRNATFGDITVAWQLREKTANGYKFNTEGLLKGQFKMLRSDVTCPQGQTLCRFTIETINDEIPEHQSDFEVFLESVIPQNAASINPNANSIRITMLPSDYPDGLLQFSLKTRRQFVNMDAKVVYLMIERLKGAKGNITVKYETRQLLSTSVKVAGITIHEAVSGRDFRAASGIINFKPQQTSATISIVLTPFSAGVDTLYPKMFHIALFEATSGASVHTEYGVANVTLVTTGEEEVWTLYGRLSEIKNLDDSAIESLLPGLTNSVAKKLTEKNLMLIEDILGKIAAEGEKRVLPHSMRASMMSIFCSLMSDRNDATRGRYQLVQLFEKWTFTYLTGKPCETAKPIEIVDCGRVKATLALWYPENINGFKYNAMYKANFQLPNNLLSTTNSGVKKCEAVQFIDYYKTEQWFMQGNQKTLLSNRVISFNIKGKASHVISSPITYRIYTTGLTLAPKRSLCVYSGTIANQWEVKTDICKVTNNLDLALDNFVDCSCQHLSNYAVQTLNPGLDVIGYPLWFKISAFICMACMILAVLAHHICSVYSMFSANLLMHMVFAIFATEVCYVINAYVSPFDILITEKGMDNYKCIVMGLFSHYFFLAQFTWLFAQALNFWKILVLNDEHTDRKYILYILIGWGLPIIIIAIFYAISFSVYRYVYSVPVTDIHIYGNVNNNGVICFITSPYAALGGLIIPCIICVMVLGVVFIQAYQVAPQWQAYDDIYRGRYNINEVRTLLLFWTLLVLTWLWGGLHLAYSQLWMLILFCIFNILLGLYALVIYTFLRNPCLPCVRPKNSSYTFPVGLNQDQHVTHYNDQSPSIADSLKGSKLSLVHDWDQDSLTQVGHMQVKRAPAIDDNIFSIYDNKVALDDERDDKDFDDLIFALKTGTLTPSELSHNIDKDYDGLHSPSATLTRDPYLGEMRRISIADTHL
ncbi:adhesion G-protein coupled receptor V1-like [Tubulanus polymorphus]|uniref:adhesion G-protein coupled receptor V1-like n=1 Tax=Tubulanus polymorphus TaxID=672921 RepID=UPI003DA2A1CC